MRVGEVGYYKGVHKVKILTESEGYWIIEALEEFNDTVGNKKVTVEVGERRIVPFESVHKRKSLAPPVKEHVYELKMEKKLQKLVAKEEKQKEKQ